MTALWRLSVVGFVTVLVGPLVVSPPAAAAADAADTRFLVTYYATPHMSQILGQRWSGCAEPNGGWGGTSSHFTITHPPCA
ncbi:hypothetical protein AAH979_40410 [Plantactinospora sp. ZYX-F-223]|uniref:hypothetical protein n=1 Tax=Plantactinospora sp. ZYX-F-223 TaxID=3144103 RepID=UPI0031FC0A73